MRGGKRNLAGRPKGPPKVRFVAYILPATLKSLTQRAFEQAVSLGAVLDTWARKKD